MIEIGRLYVKIAGRDARKKAVIVEIIDKNMVLIDGEVRRRKCNIIHLEPLDTILKIKEKASHEDVIKAFKEIGIELKAETKTKKAAKRPKKVRKAKPKSEKPVKKAAVKEEKKAKKKEEPKKTAKTQEKKE